MSEPVETRDLVVSWPICGVPCSVKLTSEPGLRYAIVTYSIAGREVEREDFAIFASLPR